MKPAGWVLLAVGFFIPLVGGLLAFVLPFFRPRPVILGMLLVSLAVQTLALISYFYFSSSTLRVHQFKQYLHLFSAAFSVFFFLIMLIFRRPKPAQKP
jgi:hypothetical protein